MDLKLVIKRANGKTDSVDLFCRVDTADEGELLSPWRHPAVCAARNGESRLKNVGGAAPYTPRQGLGRPRLGPRTP